MYYVYVDLKPDGTPFYVGKGLISRLRVGVRSRYHSNVCRKYPDWERLIIFESADPDSVIEKERHAISKFGRRDIGTGILVNQTDGGEGTPGRKCSDLTKARMSKSRADILLDPAYRSVLGSWNKGLTRTPETREKLSLITRKQMSTPEARAKIRELTKAAMARPDVKAKIAEAHARRKAAKKEVCNDSDS